jgi:hypothetical protein
MLAGHYPKRNGPSSGASEAALRSERSVGGAHPTISKGRTQPSFQSQWPVFALASGPKKAAPASGKRTLGAAFAAGAIGIGSAPHNSVQLPLVPDFISGLFCICEWPISASTHVFGTASGSPAFIRGATMEGCFHVDAVDAGRSRIDNNDCRPRPL